MTLDEVLDEMKKDFKVDPTNLEGEALRTTDGLFWKYMSLYSKAKLTAELINDSIKHIIVRRRKYYSGDGTPEEYNKEPFGYKIKNEITMKEYLKNDAEITKANQQVLFEKEKEAIYLGCLDHIKYTRGSSIKNAIEMRKFNGGQY